MLLLQPRLTVQIKAAILLPEQKSIDGDVHTRPVGDIL